MLLSKVPSCFKVRRDFLMNAHPDSAFIFPSNQEYCRNPDVIYPFRQESNFFYLSGFEEPESFLVLAPQKRKPGSYRTVLFVRNRDPQMEMWEGERYGIEGALGVFNADEAYPVNQFQERLSDLLRDCDKVYYRIGRYESVDRKIFDVLERHRQHLGRSGKSIVPVLDPNEVVGEMRLIKDSDEISFMRRAGKISALAHRAAMKEVRPGMNEYEVEALIDYTCRRQGCQRMGYGSIVAGGVNAACLHYRQNNQPLRDGELLLIDAGAELNYYTSDITRTFPIGKTFSRVQAKLYDIVLAAQEAAIALVKPGATQLLVHQRATEVLVEGLLSLGLLDGKPIDIIKAGDHRRFYPHNTGHWLGMDVHDVGLYSRNGEPRALEPGMVITVEPGFYVQPTDRECPRDFKDIGIRIEDDVLVTPNGCEILTSDVPKKRDEIEALRS